MSDAPLPPKADPRLHRLLAYWQSRRPGPDLLPGRQHIDPLDMPDLLPWIWMVDVHSAPLRFKYRLLGTEQVRVMEGDFTGQWLDEAHPRFVGSRSYPQYVAAAEQAEIGYLTGKPSFHVAKDYVSIERLLLPLARDGRRVDMLLAMTFYNRRS